MKLPRRLRKAIKRNLAPYLFISSPMLSILILVLFPVLFAFYISFTNWHLVARSRSFVGLANYIHVLKDSVFHICLWNTTYFTLVYVSSVVILGLILALMLQKLPGRFRLLMRYICFAPVVTSMVAISIVWKWLYQPSFGVFNYVLGKIGIGPYNWLTDPKIVMDSIILMTLWKSLGFVMIIFVAGLVGIPEVYYEAAKIDGATPLRALWHITLPLLKNTTLFILVTQVIGAFQIFTQTYVLTQGGPGNSSKTLVMQIYFTGFRFYRMGEASAMAYILFLILLGLTLVQLKVFKGEIIY